MAEQLAVLTGKKHKFTYSTTEQFTGEYWKDGRAIYAISFDTTFPNTTGATESLANLASNVNETIDLNAMVEYLGGSGVEVKLWQKLPTIYNDLSAMAKIWSYIDASNNLGILKITTAPAFLGARAFGTIYYTKISS